MVLKEKNFISPKQDECLAGCENSDKAFVSYRFDFKNK